MKRILLCTLAILVISLCYAQSNIQSHAQNAKEEIKADINKAGGLLYAYPGPQSVQSPTPKGYKPFYISHLGRHGSRWLTGRTEYVQAIKALRSADSVGVLTPAGKLVLAQLDSIWQDAKGRTGELTSLGMKQHTEIADRMYQSFPEVFEGSPVVTANSTQSPRVMISMFYFCDKLKEHNPHIRLDVNASVRDEKFVARITSKADNIRWTKEWEDRFVAYRNSHIDPSRLMDFLFNDKDYVDRRIDRYELFSYLYTIASIQQNCPDIDVDLFYIFTRDELYRAWDVDNYTQYCSRAAGPERYGDTLVTAGIHMLRHVIEKADQAIASGTNGATLRFSHDSYLMPLATILQLDGTRKRENDPEKYSEAFINYKISPMAGNIQMIFFKNRKGDVLVKFLLNENEVGMPAPTDMYPYYRWSDVKTYYQQVYSSML